MAVPEFARIAPDVRLGRDVKVFAFANLYGCTIGDESKIGTFVQLYVTRLFVDCSRGQPRKKKA